MKLFKIISLLLLSLNLPAQNSLCPNVEGSKEHPILTSYKNSCIVGYNEIKFDAVSFPVEKINIKGSQKTLRIEGKVIDVIYGINNSENATVLEVQRNYEKALKKGGFEILFSAFGRKNITSRRSIRDTYPSFGGVDFMENMQRLKKSNFRFAFSSHNSSQNNDYALFFGIRKEGKY